MNVVIKAPGERRRPDARIAEHTNGVAGCLHLASDVARENLRDRGKVRGRLAPRSSVRTLAGAKEADETVPKGILLGVPAKMLQHESLEVPLRLRAQRRIPDNQRGIQLAQLRQRVVTATLKQLTQAIAMSLHLDVRKSLVNELPHIAVELLASKRRKRQNFGFRSQEVPKDV